MDWEDVLEDDQEADKPEDNTPEADKPEDGAEAENEKDEPPSRRKRHLLSGFEGYPNGITMDKAVKLMWSSKNRKSGERILR
eukprot:3573915-Prymnesium_polylepis.1